MKGHEFTLKDHIQESLKDPAFRKAWKKSEVEYQLSRQLIQKRLAHKMTQGDLAKKAKTTQAVISRIESMSVNTSLDLLKRIAYALGSELKVSFQ